MSDKEITQLEMTVMEVGTTANGLEITEEMILNSLDSFTNAPIILNENESFKDYRDESVVNEFHKEKAIGVITDVKYDESNKIVKGLATYWNNNHVKDRYDNWQIEYNKGDNKFVFSAVEIF